MSIFEDIADAIGDAVEAVGDAIGDAVEWVGDAIVDAAEWVGEAFVDAAEWTGEAFLDVGDAFLTALDDTVFEVVDVATFGLVDVDYDNGNFSAEFGIDDVAGWGVSIGESGFAAEASAFGIGSGELAINEDGFDAGVQLGIDWGPLPYFDGHVALDDGNFSAGGEIHAYLPTPAGFVGGELAAGFEETDDGFRVEGSATAGYYAPTGTYAKGGVHANYEEDADGYSTEVGLHGEVGQLGLGSVRGSIDYHEGREGDVRTEGVTVSGEVETLDFEAGASVGYEHIETLDGEFDVVRGEAHVAAYGEEVSIGDGAGTVPGAVDTADAFDPPGGFGATDAVANAAAVAAYDAGVAFAGPAAAGGPAEVPAGAGPDLGAITPDQGVTAVAASTPPTEHDVAASAADALDDALDGIADDLAG
jgi:hypothetical protein